MQYGFLRRLSAVWGLVLIAVFLAACSAPAGYYRVRRGDTLSRIAQRHKASTEDLARWNRLSKPNVLAINQTLRVKPPASKHPPKRSATQARHLTRATPVLPSSIAKMSAAVPFALDWPAQGPIIRGFDGINNKGINITGKVGDPIYAAADGKVVYAGNKLRGYGNLLIIKHRADFLTAYAHNRTLYIPEGQNVKKGQRIAEMGNTDSTAAMLHFELRYQGRSLNPLHYLPAR
ncbi:peptidoglycan DD-metalloendopeptidase family protein [Mycoavidus sp. B2-EB]|uniref:peptidoglycan DD-metalloendopeptidase family protein n=1 Tax=Mycoavidus sp. B2-EB TaxID=2651972 RepID=UPI001623F424|nr:peptidoglycan DD-metalloendopeptidase family protein [Mycoavidus sp. B2-EB]BBO59708.1 peptidase [Mycoavidus sp. B2-EB]